MSICIDLTEEERNLFNLLLQYNEQSGNGTTLRVAGGWVRDKILGLLSHDIDIALDNCTGADFASGLNEFMKSQGYEPHKLSVIMANPEQSKHMETATLKVLNLPIDFVNLRSETYSDESRIPGISIGTPEEDALRRDFTINTLFYNVNNESIEDYTRTGIQDLLTTQMIRTPLNAYVTFKDDPLRILRAVRFGSRYNFGFNKALVIAARNVEIHSVLETKVSRERMLQELDGMLHHHTIRPLLAFMSIAYLGVFDIVFKVPYLCNVNSSTVIEMDTSNGNYGSTGGCNVVQIAEGRSGQSARAYYRSIMSTSVPVRTATCESTPGEDGTIDTKEETEMDMTRQSALTMLVTECHGWVPHSCVTLVWTHVLTMLRMRSDWPQCLSEATTTRYDNNNAHDAAAVPPLSRDDATNNIVIPTSLLCEAMNGTNKLSSLRSIYLAAATNGLNDIYQGENHKLIPLSVLLLKDSLKVNVSTLKEVTVIFEAIPRFQQWTTAIHMSQDIISNDNDGKNGKDGGKSSVFKSVEMANNGLCSREEAGLLLRTVKTIWRDVLWLSCADHIAATKKSPLLPILLDPTVIDTPKASSNTTEESDMYYSSEHILQSVTLDEETLHIISLYGHLEAHIENMHLENVWTLKPLVDGKRIMREIGVPSGPLVGQIMEEQLKYQLRMADECHEAALKEHLRAYLRQILEQQGQGEKA